MIDVAHLLATLRQPAPAVATDRRNGLSAQGDNRPHPDLPVEEERQDANIIDTPASRSARALSLPIHLGAVAYVGAPADCYLRRQAVVCRDTPRDH